MKDKNNSYGQSRIFGHCKFPMNLQLFAEGDGSGGNPEGGGAEGGTGEAGAAGGAEGKTNPEGEKEQTFDELLANQKYQAEFDRRTQKAIQTALTREKAKWEAMTDDKLSEAEKLARMTKEEKSQYLQQKKEKELADREMQITRKELMAEAKNTLAGKELPVELAEVLNYTDADSCSKSIAAVEKAFQKAVQSAVETRLKGKDAMRKAPDEPDSLQKQIEQIMLRK